MNGFSHILCACLSLSAVAADDSRLSLADLPAFQAALRAQEADPVARATFNDLWTRPDEYRGRRVQVEGRVALRFRQDAVGEFPALEESWVVTSGDNLICLVFPQENGRKLPSSRSRVQFTGTFVKQVRYPGGDVDRLAPLIVGPKPPLILARTSSEVPQFTYHWLDWTIGLVIAAGVALTLAYQHLRRQPLREVDELGPPPTFVTEDEDDDNP
jgi:hypothetical protein